VDDKRRLILDQALALVDERGLAAMSMRAVAERVGLTSMALYPYVGGKDALLDGLVDLLTIELGTEYGDDPADIDWRQRLRALGRAVRRLAHAHPGAFPLLLNRPAAGASASWLTAALRAVLHDAGAPADQVPRLARMICAFLLGYTTGEVTGGLPPGAAGPAGPEPGPAGPEPARPGLAEGRPRRAAGGAENPAAEPRSAAAEREARPRDAPPRPVEADGLPRPVEADVLPQPVETDGQPQPVETHAPPRPVEADAHPQAAEAGVLERAGRAEFDADLDDLIRLVEVAVRVV
jgi:AcrR family transcriptional regulator